ncbi:MAG: inositol monophosphatase [Chloroflexi bacterium]|nr:inositol monophosphatase [Chloroflexota bacterium]
MTAAEALARELRDLAVAVAEEAGELLRARLLEARVAIETKSTPTDMVSEVDRESEELVVGRLLAARPRDAILAEEGSGREGTSGVRWLIDPLDGTTNYLYGYPVFAVSIAAELDGAMVAGAVHDAARRETYAAALGAGATCGGKPIAVSPQTELSKALVGTGFGYEPGRRAQQSAVLARILPSVRDVRRSGSAALDLCFAARGRIDVYYEGPLAPWDVSAGALIVREAGGLTAGYRGGIVAAGPGVFEAFRALLGD